MTSYLVVSLKNITSLDGIGIKLTTENNSIPCVKKERSCFRLYQDGSAQGVLIHLTQWAEYNAYPEKYVLLKGKRNCRTEPYNVHVLTLLMQNISLQCSKPCRPNNFLGEKLEKIIDDLPLCSNKQELKCFNKVVEAVEKEAIETPCTKLQYKFDGEAYPGMLGSNQAGFSLRISDVIVKEEYLIYDSVALVSVFGGTMGLCIGFSFNGISVFLLGYLEQFVQCFRGNKTTKSEK